ncbi:MAG: redoxin domain-containing protein [Cyclobacteriaceae bacterium]
MNKIKPLDPVPSTVIKLLGGQDMDLSGPSDKKFRIIFFYRGYHCPVCRLYLHDIQVKLKDFKDLDTEVFAVSCDNAERAGMARDEWHIPDVPVGYAMSIEEARNWGLYVSEGRSNLEPEQFSEPGIFILQPDGKLYASVVQTMPFSRPSINQLIKDLDYIIQNNYPPRGTH